MEKRVLRFIKENRLIAGQKQLLVAVSGGPDSVCLLHILTKLQKELDIKLHIAHLDHRLRGAESEADADYVAELACQLGLPATIGACDVKAYQALRRLSPEEAAREARYDFLAEVAESLGVGCVAVGHTADDNVETVLLHLIRGTGTTGLRGLQPVSRWRSPGHNLTIVRPLLTVSRQETSDYCRICQLDPRLDSSNLSLSPLRNRIRHQLLPLLENYNPSVKESLLRTARLAGDDIAYLNQAGAHLLAGLVQRQDGVIGLDKAGFLALPVSLKRHLLREVIEELLGSLKDIEACHIEEIIAVTGKPAGRRISLPGGLIFTVEYERFLLAPESAVLSPFPAIEGEISLKIPGETMFSGWRVSASVIDRDRMGNETDDCTAHLCFAKVGDRLTVRSRQPGDRFQPLGMSQPKGLAEFMIDAKIPRAWRQGIPLVCSPQHVLWVVGFRLDDRAKVTQSAGQVLRLEFKRFTLSLSNGSDK
ncbi:MAG: tRNA lysidine(34) synthetase TilS [Chloroflexi bacterium]|nr:tRNA lysidine(34) synthetase TilS [Chloroflexota bacterium]